MYKLLCLSYTNLCIVGKRRGEELDASFSHRLCSGNNIFSVQPNMLDPRGSVLLQEGVHLVSTWKECSHGGEGLC